MKGSTMLLLNWKPVLAMTLYAALCSQLVLAQLAPPVILEIETENQVQYLEDISDASEFATDPSVTTACFPSLDPRVECAGRHMTFHAFIVLADVVAVNGQVVKGTTVFHGRRIQANPAPTPGQAIADVARDTIQVMSVEILTVDARPIGSIMLTGVGIGRAPPGAPLSVVQGNFVIVGGTGAFLGVRGQAGGGPQDIPVRLASITEDPANRRTNGGGRVRLVAHLIPMSRPEIVTTFHADFSPVTSARPAKAGEVLIVQATGLGPTLPGVNPGQRFPTDALQQVNSPVAVTVNGQAVEIVNSIGWPGLVDTYRVDFRVPDGVTAGTVTIQLTAAWIVGPSVNIPIQ
jgi:hypothetical protein